MPSDIFLRQNSNKSICLLAAQRANYTQTKNLRRWRVLGSVGLAVVSPIILTFFKDSGTALAVIGAVWTMVAILVLKGIEKNKKKRAATIQEEFDTNAFGIPWNQVLAGSTVSPEIVCTGERDCNDDREKLRDWYANTDGIPFPLDVLLCQRSNLVWDWRLRRNYGLAVAILTAVAAVIGIAVAALGDLSMTGYILGILIPSLSAYIHGIEVAKGHFESASDKEELEGKVAEMWERALQDPSSVTVEQCRNLQDRIFISRRDCPLVPDRWYYWSRDKFESDMQNAVRGLKRQLQDTLNQRDGQYPYESV